MTKLLLPILAVAAAAGGHFSAREKAAMKHVSAAALRGHIRFLADDLLEGRAPGTRGSELAMRYIAAEMERIGLLPGAADKSYYQPFDIVSLESEVTGPLSFTAAGKADKKLALKPFVDSVVSPGLQQDKISIDGAEVVFVGYGITAPEENWDDWKGLDARGKVVVVMNNDPENDPKLFAGKARLYYGRWDYKYAEAARHGAAGVIIIHTEHSAGYPWQVVQSSWSGRQFELPATGGAPRVQLKMWATEDACKKMAALGGLSLDELRQKAERRDFRPVPLGLKVSAGLKVKLARQHTANVLGLLPGSDPKLASEIVVVSAHHDHLGVRPAAKSGDDNIYNGALDNASGVATALDLAETLAKLEPRPKRSILFAAVAAEESGLLGSEFFCEHPVAPIGKLAANVNIDGINIWGKVTDVSVIGLGKSTLDDVVKDVAKAQGRTVEADPMPDKGRFYRSDQFNFAKVGVPAVYLEAGVRHPGHDAKWGEDLMEKYTKERYHQPSDQLDDSWSFDGAVDDEALLLVVIMRVADAPKMPSWRPGDEFEAARKKSLSATR